ncbi:MAG: flagellar biosynthesis protein FlhG [Ignavibacteria bacterium]|nr:MAG: flagellar biosynthesis protein FlhG [Ignavibacteria bacterium]KAF0160137.1 MAG: flagellar biosynthesis protein FlhG [Ignavibacteria bacterium]
MNGQASRLIQLRQLEERGKKFSTSKIVSICSGKGGTGKTFFAANFAYQLTRTGNKVLLIDLDLNFSNLNILLNQAAKDVISEFFEQRKSLSEIIYNYDKNLHLVFGDSGREDYPRISKEVLEYLFISILKISNNYDYIILDSSAGADELTLYQLIRSDFNIIVTSPEPTAVMDAYVIFKLLSSANFSGEKLVVVNKCTEEDAQTAFTNLFAAAKHFLGEEPKFLGAISFDEAVHKSIVRQELLTEAVPQSSPAKEITAIVNSFVSFAQVANNNHNRFII